MRVYFDFVRINIERYKSLLYLEYTALYIRENALKKKKNNTPEYTSKSRMWEADVSERKREYINTHITIRGDDAITLLR